MRGKDREKNEIWYAEREICIKREKEKEICSKGEKRKREIEWERARERKLRFMGKSCFRHNHWSLVSPNLINSVNI